MTALSAELPSSSFPVYDTAPGSSDPIGGNQQGSPGPGEDMTTALIIQEVLS